MFENGASYRVFLRGEGGKLTPRKGEYVGHEGSMFMLSIGGVRTIFDLRSGGIAYVEQVDPVAEKSRADARANRMVRGLMG